MATSSTEAQDQARPTPAGLHAMKAAYARIGRDGYPHLCPLRIGKHMGPAIEAAVLRKLAEQGFSDGQPAPQLTQAGIAYIEEAARSAP